MSYRFTQNLSTNYSWISMYDTNADEIKFFSNFFLPSDEMNFNSFEYSFLNSYAYPKESISDPTFGVFSLTLFHGPKLTSTMWVRITFVDYLSSFGALVMTISAIISFLVNSYETFVQDKSMLKLLYGEMPSNYNDCDDVNVEDGK